MLTRDSKERFKATNPFTEKGLWLVTGLMFLGKMFWWLYWGTLLEVDSVGYLEFQTALYHPPGYVVFCAAIVGIFHTVDAIVVVQSLLLSFSVGLVLCRYLLERRWQWIAGIVLAVEPCTGMMCADIMAEALFLSLVLLAFFCWQEFKWGAFAFGGLMGLAYLTRYSAPIFMLALVLLLLMARLPWRDVLRKVVWMVLAFQLVLLPMRLYYLAQFGTLRFNAFTELSLWNSAAYLFPGSDLEENPRTEFEAYLQASPDSVFEMKHTWYTNHFFNGEWPYQRFTDSMPTAEVLEAARSAGNTGLHLILHSPVRHLRAFILPNLARPFTEKHTIYSDRLPALIAHPVVFQKTVKFDYQPVWWWVGFCLLVASSVFQVIGRKRMPWMATILLLSCWLYLGAVSLVAVVFLRFVYMLVPLIVMAILLQADHYWKWRWLSEDVIQQESLGNT